MTRRPFIAALAVAALAALAGCSGAPGGTVGGSGTTAPSGTPTASRTPAALTCENMIPDATVKAFTDAGWTPQKSSFYLGDTRVEGGMMCTWGSEDSSGELFGWAPISDGQATTAEHDLLAQGWQQLDDGGRHYLTAGKDMILNPDSDGYGMTYLFGPGWVKVASTKQGLLLVDGPH